MEFHKPPQEISKSIKTRFSKFAWFQEFSRLEDWEQLFFLFVRISSIARFIPFQYNSKEEDGGVITLRKHQRMGLYYFGILWYTLDCIYLCWTSQFMYFNYVGEQEFLNYYAHFVPRTAACCFSWAVITGGALGYVKLYKSIKFISAMWTDKRIVGNEPHSNQLKLSKTTMRIGLFLAIVTHIQPIAPLGLHFDNRHSRRYWMSAVIPQSLYDSTPGIIVSASNELFLSYWALSGSGFATIIIGHCIFCTNKSLLKLRSEMKTKGISMKILRMYRILQFYNNLSNECLSRLLIPAVWVCSFVVNLVLIVTSLNGINSLPIGIRINFLFGGVALVIATEFVFHMAGQVWSLSSKFKNVGLNHCLNFAYKKKVMRSFREFRMSIRDFTYFDEFGFLLYLKLLLDQAISVLLMI